ncbi:MAG TPA: thioredoxin [bacterium]|nr:thioredoxin [bacterium]HNZ73325.1 thioredoxin [bacterium]HOH67655.1 thioredoxin [bacterium]HPN81640.1 thioredoxin [bacterium]HPW39345.1 thioredoxin [bacterium]
MSEIILTDDNFDQEVLGSSQPVLVDFFADWCGPCKMQAPIIEQLAEEIDDKAKIGKLDVDANPAIAQKYEVMSIPTLIIFKDGQVVERLTGLQSKDVLWEKFNSLI